MADKKKEEEQTGYQSKWKSQLDDVTDKILNREKFSHNLNGDAFYNQYKDRFVQQGKMAMMDTMGQAAALTGGYGSSYAQQVGQQAYQGYLQGMNDMIPELYQLALDSYDREGAALTDKYNLLAELDAQDYSRHQTQLAAQQPQTGSNDAPKSDKVTDEISGEEIDMGSIYYDDTATGSGPVLPALMSKDELLGNGGDMRQTDAVKKFKASHMTLEQALSRGITRKEYVAMVQDWLSQADLTDAEFDALEAYYGIG